MTLKDLLAYFEEYYGEKYTGAFLDTMIGYLNGYSERFYQAIAKVIPKRFSRIYSKVPDIAEIEKNMGEIMDTMERPLMLPESTYQATYGDDEKWQEELDNFFHRIRGGSHES